MQKILEKKMKGAICAGEAVNTLGPTEVQSEPMTQINTHILAKNNANLMGKVVEYGNLKKALERVKRNNGAPGVDKMQAKELLPFLKAHWTRIKRELLEGTYKPAPVRRIEIPKQDGGVRKLGIPTVLDRFIQQAIQQVLTPIFEPTFSELSYGFRPGKSARQAVRKAQGYTRSGRRVVVDIDLEKFFDCVNHDVLMTKLSKHTGDARLHKIIRRYLQAGVMLNGCCVATEEGTPQGGPISPLLANIMLNDLDKELTKRGHAFVRYADDCNIHVKSKRAGQRVFQSVTKYIEKRLKLKVNKAKSAVGRPWQRKFLGFSVTSGEKTGLRIAPRTKERFKEQVRKLTSRNKSISMQVRLKRLNAYLLGWSGYFCIAEEERGFQSLDGWIRRRLRMCQWKQWKLGKTRLSKLKGLGLSERWAASIAFSSKKYWRLSRTRQMHVALGNSYWKIQGLVSLVERQCKLLESL